MVGLSSLISNLEKKQLKKKRKKKGKRVDNGGKEGVVSGNYRVLRRVNDGGDIVRALITY